jgi:hypothetical protein
MVEIPASSIPALNIKPGMLLEPIRHQRLYEIMGRLPYPQLGEFHAATPSGYGYFGLYEYGLPPDDDELRWVLAVTNYNDGTEALRISSAISICEVERALSFHHDITGLKKFNRVIPDQLEELVNEKAEACKDHFNLEFERMEHFKKQKLTKERAHDLLCTAIDREVVAGRLAAELIFTWKDPKWEYLKPRTLWSMFCLLSWCHNRLKAPVLIERTINLHHFFDEIGGFNKKPTRWVQSRFA